MQKSALLLKLTKAASRSLSIARVSDLLRTGLDRESLAHDFVRINQEVWANLTSPQFLWTGEKVRQHFLICPEHIYCAFEDGEMVATLTNLRTTEEDLLARKSWLEKTGNGWLTTYAPRGTVGFGVDLSVVRKASRGVADKMVLVALLVSIVGENGRAVYLGARIPGYRRHRQLPVENYVHGRTKRGKPRDPELCFYLKYGFEIVEIIPDYMEDPQSLNYGVLIKWPNPLYPLTRRAPLLARVIKRLGEALLVRVPPGLDGLPAQGAPRPRLGRPAPV
jgi:hypothetical protein